VAPFCKKVEKLPKCGNWQKCNYVTTISLHRTIKTPNGILVKQSYKSKVVHTSYRLEEGSLQ
jgi:hypothetical protein